MQIKQLESQLETISLLEPSDEFVSKAQDILRDQREDGSAWGLGLRVAIAVALLVSLLINVMQFTGNSQLSELAATSQGETALDQGSLTASQEEIEPPLRLIDSSVANGIYNFLCLTKRL